MAERLGRKVAGGATVLLLMGACDQAVNNGTALGTIGRQFGYFEDTAPKAAHPPVAKKAVRKPIVFIDQGHSGNINSQPNHGYIERIDPQTGLRDIDWPNPSENEEAFKAGQIVHDKLTKDGYTVVMAKDTAYDEVFLRDRARKADDAHADIAVSIHDDHGAPNTWGAIFAQTVGGYRGEGSRKVSFTDATVAAKSQQYAVIMKDKRQVAQGIDVVIKQNSFDGRGKVEAGTLPLVELFSKTPWVYCETGAKSGLGGAALNAYAMGMANGIEAAVPIATQG